MKPPGILALFMIGSILLLGGVTPVQAVFIDSTNSPTVLGAKSGLFNLHFQPNETGELTLAFPSDADPRKGDKSPAGFRIIDNTLLDFSFAPSAGRANELRIRVGFSGDSIRAGLRRLGVRARHLRVLNYDAPGKRWVRARALRRLRQNGAMVAAAANAPAPLVWAVTNQPGGLFAVAAMLVPEPTSLLLGATGLIALARTRQPRVPG